jgi:hypothetical protein
MPERGATAAVGSGLGRVLMKAGCSDSTGDASRDLMLAIESARAVMGELTEMAESLDAHLSRSIDLDVVVSMLAAKKDKVETLKNLVRVIKLRLKVDRHGVPGVVVPRDVKARYAQMMEDFRGLLDCEARVESLVCGRGLPITKARK